MEELTTFAKRLKQARENKGLSQTALAKQVGTTSQMISAYEKATQGSRRGGPTVDTAAAIAKVLNVSLDWLTGIECFSASTTARNIAYMADQDNIELVGLHFIAQDETFDENGNLITGSYPALVFTGDTPLTQFVNELQTLRKSHTLPYWENIYMAWLQQRLDDLEAQEGG